MFNNSTGRLCAPSRLVVCFQLDSAIARHPSIPGTSVNFGSINWGQCDDAWNAIVAVFVYVCVEIKFHSLLPNLYLNPGEIIVLQNENFYN